MGVFALFIVILLLVLLLTGTLGSVLLVSFKVVGWFIVAILGLTLLWVIVSAPFRPLTDKYKKTRRASEIQRMIKGRKKLGYDSHDLENELQEIMRDLQR